MAKSFFEIFQKYTPDEQYVGWLSTASDIRMRVDKEQRMLEASMAFPALVPKRELYAVEAEIQKRQSCGRRIEGLIAALEEAREDFTESLWGRMVEKVTVFEDGLVFTLTSGEEVKVAPC